ncbi:MAG TPA: Fe-S cluster assembly ATPase SufC [Acidimicrobiales bacterium]|nr:Fe-S cluster assembly ATPase SufC [Acidimicrobiales bacterium]
MSAAQARSGNGPGRVHELAVAGLRAGVAGLEVLTGVDVVVRSGEVHAVMGPNGSGKSTLAHVLMGKPGYQVVGGTVTLDGRDLLPLAPFERSRLGLFLAPQDPIEVPGVGLHQAMTEALVGRGVNPDDATGSLTARSVAEARRVGFETRLLDRPLNVDLSGGERKRSETLQMALLRPSIAILDELDSGIDIDGLRDVARRVRDGVAEWGLGVLAITHYRRLLSVLHPDVVHVLVRGRIVASGGPELAEELERSGYAAFEKAARERDEGGAGKTDS